MGLGYFHGKSGYTVCRSVQIERIDNRGIRSVKGVLRSVNRISLVGLGYFHGKSVYIWFVDPYGSNGSNGSTKEVYGL